MSITKTEFVRCCIIAELGNEKSVFYGRRNVSSTVMVLRDRYGLEGGEVLDEIEKMKEEGILNIEPDGIGIKPSDMIVTLNMVKK